MYLIAAIDREKYIEFRAAL